MSRGGETAPRRGRRLALTALAAPLLSWSPARAAGSRFSGARPGGPLPAGWQRVPFNDRKVPTRYALVEDGGRAVLEADARGSVSLVMRASAIDPVSTPIVRWRWRVLEAPDGADNAIAAREDAAARLLFAFDGDRSKLAWPDRATMRLARSLSGRDMPYATLMYIASDAAPVGTVILNPHTGRVAMRVASPARGADGRWLSLSADLERDYREVFGEAPGRVVAWGVMSDADNTGGQARARYGDVDFGGRDGGRS